MMLRRITLSCKPISKFLTFSTSPSPPYSSIHVVESSSTSQHKPTTDFSRSRAFSRNLSAISSISSYVFLLNSSRISTFTGNGSWFLSAQCLIQQGRSFSSQAHGTSRAFVSHVLHGFQFVACRVVEEYCEALKELVEKATGSEMSDSEKNIWILKYIVKTRQRMLQLNVLAKWCQQGCRMVFD